MNETASTISLNEQVCSALEDLKGVDICVLDVRSLTTITDYMVIVSGTSDRHVRALANSVMDTVCKFGIHPIGVEGEGEGEWILVDLQDVIVHVMQKTTREFYQLERLWDVKQIPDDPAASAGHH